LSHPDRRARADASHEPPSDLAGACADSLARSRSRRRAVAERLTALRRRRRRGGLSTTAMLAGVLALGAPLALGHQTAKAPVASATLLTAGTAGDAVGELQRALGIRASRRFDARTMRAVRRFQRRNGLAVDGIVGPQTRAALGLGATRRVAAPRSVGPADASTPATAEDATATLARIAQCESGGDPTAISSDGRYRGKYQFTRETWAAMGGDGDPADAAEAEQDRLAAALYAQRGTAPWPACGRRT
jgi:hypothetical protein